MAHSFLGFRSVAVDCRIFAAMSNTALRKLIRDYIKMLGFSFLHWKQTASSGRLL